jgi:hypothetical protein
MPNHSVKAVDRTLETTFLESGGIDNYDSTR